MTRSEAEAIVKGFETVFLRYLEGVGHVSRLQGYVTPEEYQLRASDPLFRAKVTLKQLTDSWLLPIGNKPENRIKI